MKNPLKILSAPTTPQPTTQKPTTQKPTTQKATTTPQQTTATPVQFMRLYNIKRGQNCVLFIHTDWLIHFCNTVIVHAINYPES